MMERIRRATANDRFKGQQAQWMHAGGVLAIGVHVAVFSLVRFEVQDLAASDDQPLRLVLPPEVAPPEPPAPQPTGTLSVSPEITRTMSGEVPKAEAATCWMTASLPWPCSVIEVWMTTAPV